MKKVFGQCAVGAILVAALATARPVQAGPIAADEKEQKQKVKIVVVEKRERPGAAGQSQSPPSGSRGRRS